MNENCFFVHDALFSGVSMNGFELPQNRNDLLRFTQAIKYDDPDSISLSIGDALMHRRSEGG